MFETYRKLTGILDKRERRLAFIVLLLTTIVSVVEVLGVASIMPFMAVLGNPSVIQTNSILSSVYKLLGFQSNDSFLFFLGVCVLIFLVGSTILRAFVVWIQVYYANLRSFSISHRLVSGYLRKPYQWFLVSNSSKLAASILEQVSRVVHSSLYPALRLVTHGLIAFLLIILFVIVDPTLAISIALLLVVAYGAIYKFATTRLAESGNAITSVQNERLKAVQEAFGGIKDVKIYGLENAFMDKYRVPARKFALSNISIKLWSEMPSFGMQALVFGGMMVMILYLMKTRESLEDIIPVLAMYALGGYKLMPSLQEIYRQLASIKGSQSALNAIYKDIHDLEPSNSEHGCADDSPLSLEKYIELRELKFSYPGTSKRALDNINLKIEKNNIIGFVGRSGSGKTTVVDIILGLLHPKNGGVFVDGQVIDNNNVRSWQRNLGYVPQQIFLTDDSIAANIAFGIPEHEINMAAVKRAAKIANLHEFIENELAEGYDALVGERGIRLSGGQRQRIGIARALYSDPDILMLDEATSALDNVTERSVMDAIREIGYKKTIIIVAHRLSTVQLCDKLFLFEKGKLSASGSYEELIDNSAAFREMALVQK